MQQYLPRIVDRELALRLEAFGATLIVGPKWCGKTTTGQQQAKSILRMQDPDKKAAYLATAEAKPSLLLKGDNPRLIDEWADCPRPLGRCANCGRHPAGRRPVYSDRLHLRG